MFGEEMFNTLHPLQFLTLNRTKGCLRETSKDLQLCYYYKSIIANRWWRKITFSLECVFVEFIIIEVHVYGIFLIAADKLKSIDMQNIRKRENVFSPCKSSLTCKIWHYNHCKTIHLPNQWYTTAAIPVKRTRIRNKQQ